MNDLVRAHAPGSTLASNKPRELTIMERLTGIAGQLQHQSNVVRTFENKLAGEPDVPSSVEQGCPSGLVSMLGYIETLLRDNNDKIAALRDRF